MASKKEKMMAFNTSLYVYSVNNTMPQIFVKVICACEEHAKQ